MGVRVIKKAVMYGAGNIGRGFIGQIFSLSGYEVVFVDVDLDIISALNTQHRYTLRIVSNEKISDEWVENVRGIDGNNEDEIAREISEADIMATAVGVNILPKIAPVIAKGLALRWGKKNNSPLNVIVCENLLNAAAHMAKLVSQYISPEQTHKLQECVGFVDASIGRMVPTLSREQKKENPLLVMAEPYNTLPVDREAFKGEIPRLVNLLPFSPFEFYVKRKLFIHNMGHATLGYLGWLKGYRYIYQAGEDKAICKIAEAAMLESAKALNMQYNVPMSELEEHVSDLIERFKNRRLGDSINRVGGDPMRKLSSDDRFFGALKCCIDNKTEWKNIALGIAAALHYDSSEDATANILKKQLEEMDIEGFIKERLSENYLTCSLVARIEAAYSAFSAIRSYETK